MMSVEKLNKEIEKLNGQIAVLTEKKKKLEAEKKMAVDAELASVFNKKKINAESFLVFNQLNEEQLKKLIEQAQQMAGENAAPDNSVAKSGSNLTTKESTEE